MATHGDFDVFVSYNWRDHEVVERVAHGLREAGLHPFLDRWYLVPGESWQSALEKVLGTCDSVAVFVGPGEMGPWQQRERDFAMERQGRSPGFRVIPVLLPGSDPVLGFLGQNTWVDLRQGTDEPASLAILAAAIRGEAPSPGLSALSSICPYRGLLYFREEDAPFFFGRDRAIDELAAAVRRERFVAVVGASGCGKSSVVRAGLVHRLRQDREATWEAVALFPGEQPLSALAKALIPSLEPEMTETERLAEAKKLGAFLAKGEVPLHDIADRILSKQDGTDRLLLVVDQWEELYTLARDEGERRRFIDEILDASARGTLRVVITLRGDFVGKALAYRPLSDRLQGAQQNLGPMNHVELEQAVTGPATKVSLSLEPGLVNIILRDVAEEPGNLPLLEFVLKRLWEDRERGMLTHAAYDAMGGLHGALAKRAETIFGQLTPLEQETVRKVFLQMVRPGEGGEDTRRRASAGEIGEAAWGLVKKLADERLLVTARRPGEPDTVEVSHEALIYHWVRLRTWVNEDREFLLWRERFRLLYTDWLDHARVEARLLPASLLAEAQRWVAERGEALPEQERGFITESARVEGERTRKDHERLERELAQATKLAEESAKREQEERAHAEEMQRQRAAAESTRDQAEQLVNYLVFELRDKLTPIGRLDLLDDVSRRAAAYYQSLGDAGSPAIQRRRSIASHNRGDVLVAQGKLEEALQAYETFRAIAGRLADQDDRNTLWQRDLSISHEKVGNVLVEQGKLKKALQTYEASHSIRERLAKQDPGNAQWQRDLSLSHSNIGSVLMAQGKLKKALQAFEAYRAIADRLAKQDPTNAQWQRDLSRSHDKVGDMLKAQGKLEEAQQAYESSLPIRERLAEQDPNNAQSQRDLSISHDNIGDVLKAQGKLEEALQAHETSLAIAIRLARQDASNTEWQRDLSLSHDNIGNVLEAQGKLRQALQAHEASLPIVEHLAKLDPSNATWRDDLEWVTNQIAEVKKRLKSGK